MVIHAKLCGISDVQTVEAVIASGAHCIGFVHFPKSPRHVTVERMAELVHAVDGRAQTVAVVVNPDDLLLEQLVAANIDIIQLHGAESPERVAQVKHMTGKPVMKAIAVAEAADLEVLAAYQVADYLLLDAKAPKGADLPGGNGEAFDWTLLKAAVLPGNTVLSGGLTPENVVQAVRTSGVSFVDVSSGIESQPGVKDVTKIQQFMDKLGDV